MRSARRMVRHELRRGSGIAAAILTFALATSLRAAEPVDFQGDIRPLLSDRCFACHGPDANTREADLRLDQREGALAEKKGRRAIVPGDPEASEILRRLRATDPDERMPPADSGKSLSEDEIALIERWIREGASWEEHWSFVPPTRPELPKVSNEAWVKNPIDRFILARLDREGL